jgi:hypothetical protein
MLKLTRHLFAWSPSAATMDFYERALTNHILGSQDPKTGMMIYYCPLKPGAFKMFSTPTDSFWCCVGTGMENHAKYNDTIYFHDSPTSSGQVPALYVNLFIPSVLTWKDKGLKLTQRTKYPEEDSTSLLVEADSPVRLALRIRYPGWAKNGMTIRVNSQPQTISEGPGSYVTIDRAWKTGDLVTIRIPMSLHMEALPDDAHIQALMFGPVVLAGDLGTAGLENINRYGPSEPPVDRVSSVDVPTFVANSPADVIAHVKPVEGQPLTFRTSGLGKPNDATLIPLYKTFEPRYTVYWTVYSTAEYDAHKTELASAAAKHRDIESRTIDRVDVNSDESEKAHGFTSGSAGDGFVEQRRWRDAGRGGFLSYTLKIRSDAPASIVGTFRGSEGQRRAFDVLVDGEKVASETLEYHPAELLDREYQIPDALTRGKSSVTIRLVPQPNARTGGVVEIRTVAR